MLFLLNFVEIWNLPSLFLFCRLKFPVIVLNVNIMSKIQYDAHTLQHIHTHTAACANASTHTLSYSGV